MKFEKLILKQHYFNDEGQFMLTHDGRLFQYVHCDCKTCDYHRKED